MSGYRWWTFSAGRDQYGTWLKAGPIAMAWSEYGFDLVWLNVHSIICTSLSSNPPR